MAVGRSAATRNAGGLGLAIGDTITSGPARAAGRAKQRVLQIGCHISLRDPVSGRLFIFQGVLLDRAIDLAKVIDARVFLRSDARADEVWDRDGGQQPDDGNHDHDFDEREARLQRFSIFHGDFTFSVAM